MRFSGLTIHAWRQFQHVELEFHPRVTIITGANGAGKSTLLRLLSQQFGWAFQLLSTPEKAPQGSQRYLSGIRSWLRRPPAEPTNSIGSVTYSNGVSSYILIPETSGPAYHVQFSNAQPMEGLQISSHRAQSSYQAVSAVPTNALSVQQAYQAYYNEMVNKYNNSFSSFSPTYRMKEAIISMAMFGPGNANVSANPVLSAAYDAFKRVLRDILPESIGFMDLSIRVPDVVIVTKSGEFMLDAASGGLMSLIDLAWQVFLYGYDKSEFVVILDEPENHLHPSMQRRILSDLSRAFPSAQFVVATHSPFVVSSVKDSAVYVLRHAEGEFVEGSALQRTVSSLRLDRANKAGTASEILRDVLGVPITLPEWAESELRQIADQYEADELTPDGIKRLRADLSNAGLAEYYPDALQAIVERA